MGMLILVFTCIYFVPSQYDGYIFPAWAKGAGLMISMISVLAIPIVAVYQVLAEKSANEGSFMEVAKKLTKPTEAWGPRLKEHRMLVKASQGMPLETVGESQSPMLTSGPA